MTNQLFQLDTSISLPGVSASSVAWADYSGDGKLDFLLTGRIYGFEAHYISKLYKNTGSGFVEDTNISLPGVSSGSVAWADYNGDGKQDFLLTGYTVYNSPFHLGYPPPSSGLVISKLYKNTGSGFVEDTNISLPGVYDGSVAWADYNGDSKPDFLLTGHIYTASGLISKLYKNTGSGFVEDTNISLPAVCSDSVAWADYSGDGKQDFLLTGSDGSGRISKLYKNTGSGFVEDTNINLPGVNIGSVAWADYSGDGKQDFLLTGYSSSGYISKLYKNTASGFVEDTSISLPGVYLSSVTWADYSGDGKQDFLLTGQNSYNYDPYVAGISKLYKNTGSGFVEDTNISLPAVQQGSVGWADYSGDGKQDFLLTGSTRSGVISELYLNTTITPFSNNAPTANNDSQTTGSNTSVTLNILANDSDADVSITGVDLDINIAGVQSQDIVASPDTFNINNGVLNFTPMNNFTGTASLAYQAIDNIGATSNISTVSITTSFLATAEAEIIIGTENADKIDGLAGNDTISSLGGNDSLTGNDGDDSIDGGIGYDSMYGGNGNDIYLTDSAKDKVIESLNAGTDSIFSAVTYTIPTNTENLTLQGTQAINGKGNNLANQIVGNSATNKMNGGAGNDTITGLAGSDLLTGGTGNDSLEGGNGNDILIGNAGNDAMQGGTGIDRFIYNTNATFAISAIGVDMISDFTKSQSDKIILDKTTFRTIRSVAGNSFNVISEFASLTSKFDTSKADIVYDISTGKLFYNQNGNIAGYGTGGHFMTLTNKPALSASDFIIQA